MESSKDFNSNNHIIDSIDDGNQVPFPRLQLSPSSSHNQNNHIRNVLTSSLNDKPEDNNIKQHQKKSPNISNNNKNNNNNNHSRQKSQKSINVTRDSDSRIQVRPSTSTQHTSSQNINLSKTSPQQTGLQSGSPNDSQVKWLVAKEFTRIRTFSEISDSEDVKELVERLRDFRDEWRKSDPDPYWHRKSGKIVLAVLMTKQGDRKRFHRGINSELSLPSGSNCAERAAISTALSDDLNIKRKDFAAIAVMDPSRGEGKNPIPPCGVCDEWLKKIQEASPSFCVVTFTTSDMQEVRERYPILYFADTFCALPEEMRKKWGCKCGMEFNPGTNVICEVCDQPRYRFRPKVQKSRMQILKAISQIQIIPINNSVEINNKFENSINNRSPVISSTSPSLRNNNQQINNNNKFENENSSEIINNNSAITYKMWLAKLSEQTGLSDDLVSKTIKDLLSLQFITNKRLNQLTQRAILSNDDYYYSPDNINNKNNSQIKPSQPILSGSSVRKSREFNNKSNAITRRGSMDVHQRPQNNINENKRTLSARSSPQTSSFTEVPQSFLPELTEKGINFLKYQMKNKL